MGNDISSELPPEFDPDQIRRLYLRFFKLDSDNNGYISLEEFTALPQVRANPLATRVLEVFDRDGNGLIDFREFAQGMTLFSSKANIEQKLRVIFSIYDMDRDGFISNADCFRVLKMMVGDNLTDVQLQQTVDKSIIYHDKDGDGKLSFSEFKDTIGMLGSQGDKLGVTL
ncbi:calcineurin subunit B type 1-like [Paramacrobiotus metropolitanus]|uniref:calcineurin subunit B type 1-like n=1 Tax=Paramacrobiotus metropolitanus TaxID=2943436 RepID=UPI00244649D7|nr:calcineurin subunit B type 1-like [Paramacrobiotus metropolitanus]